MACLQSKFNNCVLICADDKEAIYPSFQTHVLSSAFVGFLCFPGVSCEFQVIFEVWTVSCYLILACTP